MSSRKRLLTRGVLIGYGALVSQIFYSLASIPLTLSYLSKEEFGLWSLVSTISTYFGLLELGMTQAFTRHLFECKDSKKDGRYGRFFAAGTLTVLLVAVVMLVGGSAAALVAGGLLGIPPELQQPFRWLLLASVALASIHVAFRMVGAALYVHQRHDLIQLSQICVYVLMFLVLYLGLRAGWGVYSLLASTAVAGAWGLVFGFIACRVLGLYPPKGTWKLPQRDEWLSVLRYSRDVFILQVGGQLVNGLPMLLMPRLLGLEAVAIWTVCTRSFNILRQVVGKPFEYSVPMLCEMYARGETRRTAVRWIQVTQLVTALAVCVFSVGAANNSSFIRLWVGSHMLWPLLNDWLIAAMFFVLLCAAATFNSVGFRKQIGSIRFAPYLEAALIALNAWWMTRLWGLAGMIVLITAAPVLTRFWWGLHYLAAITGSKRSELLRESMLRPLAVLPFAALLAWACAHLHTLLPGYAGLFLSATIGTLLSGTLVLFLGVSQDVRNELLQMLMKPLGRLGKFGKQKVES
jgi:O-antigen/teichoic acid export membrane protein